MALDHFIAGSIGFMDMAPLVEATLDAMSREFRLEGAIETLDTVLQTDHLARIRAAEQASQLQEKRA